MILFIFRDISTKQQILNNTTYFIFYGLAKNKFWCRPSIPPERFLKDPFGLYTMFPEPDSVGKYFYELFKVLPEQQK